MLFTLIRVKIIILTSLCLFCACHNRNEVSSQNTELPKSESARKYDTVESIADLKAKTKRFDSYAQDYIFQGQPVKRMSFLFKKKGKDFYVIRSDYFQNGVKYSRLFNVDGKYDYEYSPKDKIAYRRPTQSTWNESNYAKAKDWHFNFDGFEVVGEKQIAGKDFYLMEDGEDVITVSKETGLKTSLIRKDINKPPLEYGNFEFNLSEDEFTIPSETQIREN